MARDVTLEIGAQVNTTQIENALQRVRGPIGKVGSMLGNELAFSGERASASMSLLGQAINALSTGSFGFLGLTLAISGSIIVVKNFVEWINKADEEAKKLEEQNKKLIESFKQQKLSLEEEREILNIQKQYTNATFERARTTRDLIKEETKLQEILSEQPRFEDVGGDNFKKAFSIWKIGYLEQKAVVDTLSESISLLIDKEIEEAEAKEKTLSPIKEKTKAVKEIGFASLEARDRINAMFDAMVQSDNKMVSKGDSGLSIEEVKFEMITRNMEAQEAFANKEIENADLVADKWSGTASIISGAFGQALFDLAAGTEMSFKIMVRNIMMGVGQMAIAEGTMHLLKAAAYAVNPFTAAFAPSMAMAGGALLGFGASLMVGGGLMQRSMGGGSSSGVSPIGSSEGFADQGFAGSGSQKRSQEQTVYIDRVIVIGNPDPAVGREIKKHIEAADRIGA